jgi:hypothetical protein
MEKKYSFDDWFSGEVNLDTEPLFYNNKKINNEDEKSSEKDNYPKVVSLNSFSVDDQKRIIDVKTESFMSKVHFHYNLFYKSFLKDFEKSQYKLEFINKTINEIDNILNPKQDVISDTRYLFWNVRFDKDNLIMIKEFADLYFLKGKTLDFLFEHSENSKYNLNKDTITNEVYAYSLNKMKKELLKLKYRTLNSNFDSIDNFPTEEVKIEPKNLDTNIFVNGYGSDLFDNLFELITDKDNPVPSISFIFRSLKTIKVIKVDVSPSEFVNFIRLNKGIIIDETKIHNRPPKKFITILRNIINKHYKGVFEIKDSQF